MMTIYLKLKIFLQIPGYSGKKFANSVSEILERIVGVVKRSGIYIFKVTPTKDGLQKGPFLGLINDKNYRKTMNNIWHISLQMIVLAFLCYWSKYFKQVLISSK